MFCKAWLTFAAYRVVPFSCAYVIVIVDVMVPFLVSVQ